MSGADTSIILAKEFFPGFDGGVRLATADINKDGKTEVIAATGPGDGEARIVSMSTDQEKAVLNPFGESYLKGLYISGSGRTTGGGSVQPFWSPPEVNLSSSGSTMDLLEGGSVTLSITRTGDLTKSCSGSIGYGGTATGEGMITRLISVFPLTRRCLNFCHLFDGLRFPV